MHANPPRTTARPRLGNEAAGTPGSERTGACSGPDSDHATARPTHS